MLSEMDLDNTCIIDPSEIELEPITKFKHFEQIISSLKQKIGNAEKKLAQLPSLEEITEEKNDSFKETTETTIPEIDLEIKEEQEWFLGEKESIEAEKEIKENCLFEIEEELTELDISVICVDDEDLSDCKDLLEMAENLEDEITRLNKDFLSVNDMLSLLDTKQKELEAETAELGEKIINTENATSTADCKLEELEGELAMLKSSLLQRSDNPNSVFSEVNDKREIWQKKMNQLKSDYEMFKEDDIKLTKTFHLLEYVNSEMQLLISQENIQHGVDVARTVCSYAQCNEVLETINKLLSLLSNEMHIIIATFFEPKNIFKFLDMSKSKIVDNIDLQKTITAMNHFISNTLDEIRIMKSKQIHI